MKRLISYAFVLASLASMYACSSEKVAPQVCTPGDRSNCNCAAAPDGTPTGSGTRLCRADGKSFDPCRLSETKECPYGEEPDVDAGGSDGGGGPGDVDQCPGSAVAIQGAAITKLEGDTTNASDNFNGNTGTSCATGEGSPDVVYKLIPADTGLLSMELLPDSDWSPFMYLREGSCEDAAAQFGCVPGGQSGSRVVLNNRPVVKGREYWLVVDGAAGPKNKGKFFLELKLVPGKVCGDGTIDDGEACDDGNNKDNDGCDASCKSINGNPLSGGSCPGQPVHLWTKNFAVTGAASTNRSDWEDGAPDNSEFTSTNANCAAATNGGAASDHIYSVTPHDTGTLEVKVTGATFDVQLIGRKVCADPTSQFLCTGGPCNRCVNAAVGTNGNETLSFAVQKDQVYAVGVDSNGPPGSNTGKYNISFTLKP